MRAVLASLAIVCGALLLCVRPLLESQWYGWTFACTRSGWAAGTCHAEPTLRDRLGLGGAPFDWQDPRIHFMPLLAVDEIDHVAVDDVHGDCIYVFTKHGSGDPHEGGDGYYELPLDADSFCYGGVGAASDQASRRENTARVAADFESFLHSTRNAFRLRTSNKPVGAGLWIANAATALGALLVLAGALLLFESSTMKLARVSESSESR